MDKRSIPFSTVLVSNGMACLVCPNKLRFAFMFLVPYIGVIVMLVELSWFMPLLWIRSSSTPIPMSTIPVVFCMV